MIQIFQAAKNVNMLDLGNCAIDFQECSDPVDFGKSTYKIKHLIFYSCGVGINGGLMTQTDFKNVLIGIKNSSLSNSLKRMSALELGIEDDTLDTMMEEHELDNIKLTKDY